MTLELAMTADIVAHATAQGVALEMRDGGRIFAMPAPSPELAASIRMNKTALLCYLIAQQTADVPTEDRQLCTSIHALLDKADAMDRAGDEAGAVRFLAEIQKLLARRKT